MNPVNCNPIDLSKGSYAVGNIDFPGKGKHLGLIKQSIDTALKHEGLNLKDRADSASRLGSDAKVDISFEYASTVIQGQIQKSVNGSFGGIDAILPVQAGVNGNAIDPFSPEAVANRIMGFIEGVFNRFAETGKFAGKTGEEAKQVVNKFVEMAGKAVQKGFNEAKSILGALDSPPGKDVMNKAEQTFGLVMQKLESFRQAKVGETEPGSETVQDVPNQLQAQQFSFHAEISYEASVSVVQNEVAKSVTRKFNLSVDVSITTVNGTSGSQQGDGAFNPEKVAEQIMKFVGNVFDRVMAGKDFSGNTAEEVKGEVDNFMKTAKDAVSEGFQQANAVLLGSGKPLEDGVPVKLDKIHGSVLEAFKKLYASLLEKLNQFPKEEDVGAAKYRNASYRFELSMQYSASVLQDNMSRSFSQQFGFSFSASFAVEGGEKDVSSDALAGQVMNFVQGVFAQLSAEGKDGNSDEGKKEKQVAEFVKIASGATEDAFRETKAVLGRAKQAQNSPALQELDEAHKKVKDDFGGLASNLLGKAKDSHDRKETEESEGNKTESHKEERDE